MSGRELGPHVRLEDRRHPPRDYPANGEIQDPGQTCDEPEGPRSGEHAGGGHLRGHLPPEHGHPVEDVSVDFHYLLAAFGDKRRRGAGMRRPDRGVSGTKKAGVLPPAGPCR